MYGRIAATNLKKKEERVNDLTLAADDHLCMLVDGRRVATWLHMIGVGASEIEEGIDKFRKRPSAAGDHARTGYGEESFLRPPHAWREGGESGPERRSAPLLGERIVNGQQVNTRGNEHSSFCLFIIVYIYGQAREREREY